MCSIQQNVTSHFLQRQWIYILWNKDLLFFFYRFLLHESNNSIEKTNFCIEKAQYIECSFPEYEIRGIWQFWLWSICVQSFNGRTIYVALCPGEKPASSFPNEENSPCIWDRDIKTHIWNEGHHMISEERIGRDLPWNKYKFGWPGIGPGIGLLLMGFMSDLKSFKWDFTQ